MVFKITFGNAAGTILYGDFVAVKPVAAVIMDIHNTHTTSKDHHSTHSSLLGNRIIARRPCLISFLVEVKCAEFCLHYSWSSLSAALTLTRRLSGHKHRPGYGKSWLALNVCDDADLGTFMICGPGLRSVACAHRFTCNLNITSVDLSSANHPVVLVMSDSLMAATTAVRLNFTSEFRRYARRSVCSYTTSSAQRT